MLIHDLPQPEAHTLNVGAALIAAEAGEFDLDPEVDLNFDAIPDSFAALYADPEEF